jgi:hypothetical protein
MINQKRIKLANMLLIDALLDQCVNKSSDIALPIAL